MVGLRRPLLGPRAGGLGGAAQGPADRVLSVQLVRLRSGSPAHLCSPNSGSRGWSAGWARCSCRTAPPGPRPPRSAPRCAAGAATRRGSSTARTRACASRSSSASSEVGPRRPCRSRGWWGTWAALSGAELPPRLPLQGGLPSRCGGGGGGRCPAVCPGPLQSDPWAVKAEGSLVPSGCSSGVGMAAHPPALPPGGVSGCEAGLSLQTSPTPGRPWRTSSTAWSGRTSGSSCSCPSRPPWRRGFSTQVRADPPLTSGPRTEAKSPVSQPPAGPGGGG